MAVNEFRLTFGGKKLLGRHFGFYRDLDLGRVGPETPEQRAFVAVCRGTHQPKTNHESAYANLKKLARLSSMSEEELAGNDFKMKPRRSPTAGVAGEAVGDSEDFESDLLGPIPHYQVYDASEAWFPRRECWVSKLGRR